MTDVDPDAVAAATLAAPSVARMSGGALGEVATFLPGRRVPGVRVRPDGVDVHIVARFGANLPLAADEVRRLVRPHAADLPVSVFIDDIVLPGEEQPELPAAGDTTPASPGSAPSPTGARSAPSPTGAPPSAASTVTSTPLDEVVPPPPATPGPAGATP